MVQISLPCPIVYNLFVAQNMALVNDIHTTISESQIGLPTFAAFFTYF